MPDTAPKSAYEIAMERLRRKDAEDGTVDAPLSEEQKASIAEIRRVTAAKIAEIEILHRPKIQASWDPAELTQLEEAYRRDVQRINDERDAKIARIRSSGPARDA